jgi:hypothetical protein
MQSQAWAIAAEPTVEQLHLRIAWLCGEVLFLEGYDRRRWPRDTLARRGVAGGPLGFTEVLTAGTSGLLLGSLGAGLLGDQLGRKSFFQWHDGS